MHIEDYHLQYLSFIRFCLSDEKDVPADVAKIDWEELLNFAKKHAIVGVVARTLLHDQRLANSEVFLRNRPSEDQVMDWMSLMVKIEQDNQKCDGVAAWTIRNFKKTGFDACILKGQGVNLLYPTRSERMSGDVDIWVRPKHSDTSQNETIDVLVQQSKDVERVLEECRKVMPDAKACYHHVEFVSKQNIPIEVHYRPQWLSNPWHNRKLQRYFMTHADEQFRHHCELSDGQVLVTPTAEFNVIFMLSHIYNHLLHEGIGFRQLIDYFYLLKSVRWSDTSRSQLQRVMSDCGLLAIGQGVSWMMVKVLELDEAHIIVTPSERYGRILLREVLAGGNFGKHDERTLSGVYRSPIMANLQRLNRDIRFLFYFPSESLWEPFFRLYHFFWRKQH
jgi:hypothetical protein